MGFPLLVCIQLLVSMLWINPSSSSLGVTGVYCVSLVPDSICIIVSLFGGPCSRERERELNLHNQPPKEYIGAYTSNKCYDAPIWTTTKCIQIPEALASVCLEEEKPYTPPVSFRHLRHKFSKSLP